MTSLYHAPSCEGFSTMSCTATGHASRGNLGAGLASSVLIHCVVLASLALAFRRPPADLVGPGGAGSEQLMVEILSPAAGAEAVAETPAPPPIPEPPAQPVAEPPSPEPAVAQIPENVDAIPPPVVSNPPPEPAVAQAPETEPVPEPSPAVSEVSTAATGAVTAPHSEPPPVAAAPGTGAAPSAGGAGDQGPVSGVSGTGTNEPLKLLNEIFLRYPESSRLRREEGLVRLCLRVNAKGRVAAVDVLSSSGYQTLDNAAVSAAKRARFKPRVMQGNATECAANLSIRFKLLD